MRGLVSVSLPVLESDHHTAYREFTVFEGFGIFYNSNVLYFLRGGSIMAEQTVVMDSFMKYRI